MNPTHSGFLTHLDNVDCTPLLWLIAVENIKHGVCKPPGLGDHGHCPIPAVRATAQLDGYHSTAPRASNGPDLAEGTDHAQCRVVPPTPTPLHTHVTVPQ